ncbi:MAG: hypothetical protein HQL35_15210 [Alphaproteobacteria bacterium]|nr:hypothetical protein [Alphaproteobacteria bacterium]
MYKPATAAKGVVDAAMGAWYLAATRDNMAMLEQTMIETQITEELLRRRAFQIQQQIDVYQNDVRWCQ